MMEPLPGETVHGPHTCSRCLAEGRPAVWQHRLVQGRACPMPAVSDCVEHRKQQMPGLARKETAA